MKIAVLISGQPRFLRSTGFKSIKEKLLDKYDCDVFCHFWWNSEGGSYITAPWSGLGTMKMSNSAESDIIQLYRPKKIKWDLPIDPKTITKSYPRTTNSSTWYNLPSMYTSMKKSYELLTNYIEETGTEYDWVIRLRYDAILTSFPDLNKLQKGFLYDCDYSQFHNSYGNNGLIMSYDIASIIMNIYDFLDEIYDRGVLFNDEQLVTGLIKMKNIPAKILPKDKFYIDLCRNE